LDTAGNVTGGANLVATGMPYGSSSFLRNRVINGDMRIDQRNAGSSITPTGSGTYIIDRWNLQNTQASKFLCGQNLGSVTPPAGFPNYLGVSVSSAYSVTASDYFNIDQPIEANNTSDWNWGTANAKTVTLSFWVYSSLTGSFGGTIKSYNNAYAYPFLYTISSANTWTYITLTIPGPTSGTWNTGNNGAILIQFGLGVGSTYSGTAGAWAAAAYQSATGAVSVVGTSGATWYVTGVQLEQGSVATPFERPLISEQIADCLRYYFSTNGPFGGAAAVNAGTYVTISFPVPMRAIPTVVLSGSGTFSGTTIGYNILYAQNTNTTSVNFTASAEL